MKKINYLEILKNAFLLTWKNKFLWLFGLFIFLGSIGSNADVFFRSMGDKNQDPQLLVDFAERNPNLFIAISLALLIFGIVIYLLRIIATTAVVKSANNIKLYSQLPFSKIFVESKKYLWKLLMLEILISFSVFAIAVLLIVPIAYLFLIKAEIFAILMSVLAFVILFPLVILAVYLNKYAYLFLILGDFEIKDSLELAYIALAKNIKESLVMGVISLGLSLAIMIVLAFVGIIILAIFGALGFLANMLFANTGMISSAIIGGITGIVILTTLLSWYATLIQTAWLFFFQEISFEKDNEKKKKVAEKVDIEVPISDPEAI